MTEIERALNLIESHTINHSDPNRVYYTYTRQVDFYFEDHIDPYGSPFYHNSRLLATTGYFYVDIPLENLCYCVDSYTGLGYGQAQTNESPVHWHLRFIQGVIREQQVGHHFLTVKYGRRNVIPDHNEY